MTKQLIGITVDRETAESITRAMLKDIYNDQIIYIKEAEQNSSYNELLPHKQADYHNHLAIMESARALYNYMSVYEERIE